MLQRLKYLTRLPKFNFTQFNINKRLFSSYEDNYTNGTFSARSGYDRSNRKYDFNIETIFEMFKSCNLIPTKQNGNIRLKYCPCCEKPHNEESSNLNTFVFYQASFVFHCFRCGNRGHFARLLKVLKKKYKLEGFGDLSQGGTTTENEDLLLNNQKRLIIEGNKDLNNEKRISDVISPAINRMSNTNYSALPSKPQDKFKLSISNISLIQDLYKRNSLLDNPKCQIIKDYLINERKLNYETLLFYNIGVSYEKFRNNDYEFLNLPTVTFPMFYPIDPTSFIKVDKSSLDEATYQKYRCDIFYLSKFKLRAIGKEFKHFQRVEPHGSLIWYGNLT